MATTSVNSKHRNAVFGDPFPAAHFEKEKGSPFTDGYSIKKEEAALAAYIADGASEDDPLYERFIELHDRRERLEQMNRERDERAGADPIVSNQEARGVEDLGGLVDDGVDQMTIHTIEAHRMFVGRAREAGNPRTAIIGGKRVASALRNLWLLTSNDNPYADWALVRHEHSVNQVLEHLRAETAKAEASLNSIRHKGLSFSVLSSSSPMSLNLGFRSPYGYSISMLIVEYDYFVRVQKTLQRKNMQNDEDTRKALSTVARGILNIFYGTTRFDRWLSQPEIRTLNRLDWVTEDQDAAKRVEFSLRTFGPVPAAIYTGELAPSHSRRRYSLTEAERDVLEAVGSKLQEAEDQAANAAEDDQLDTAGAASA
ncbi:PFL_4669 family integrating conjugative element protein [Comamonas sp.]|uniref:PFL_4669 family integrating conjugative element protein n=1 Tax=Comamonas sp. TaxID=34028 RepID=UPI0025898B9E|nr:TIGR03761 family integrating conjugative element protein [Comamonas sp.]